MTRPGVVNGSPFGRCFTQVVTHTSYRNSDAAVTHVLQTAYMPEKSRKPLLNRAMSIAGVVLILGGPALGASGAPWWTVLILVVVVLGVGYAIGARLQSRDDHQSLL
jgi:hypothetical protein